MMRFDGEPEWGSYQVGDGCRVRITDGRERFSLLISRELLAELGYPNGPEEALTTYAQAILDYADRMVFEGSVEHEEGSRYLVMRSHQLDRLREFA